MQLDCLYFNIYCKQKKNLKRKFKNCFEDNDYLLELLSIVKGKIGMKKNVDCSSLFSSQEDNV